MCQVFFQFCHHSSLALFFKKIPDWGMRFLEVPVRWSECGEGSREGRKSFCGWGGGAEWGRGDSVQRQQDPGYQLSPRLGQGPWKGRLVRARQGVWDIIAFWNFQGPNREKCVFLLALFSRVYLCPGHSLWKCSACFEVALCVHLLIFNGLTTP